MNIATITAIVLAGFSALILGMAALIRAMVTDKLDGIVRDVRELRKMREDDSGKIQGLDVRLSKVEERCGINTTWPGINRRCSEIPIAGA